MDESKRKKILISTDSEEISKLFTDSLNPDEFIITVSQSADFLNEVTRTSYDLMITNSDSIVKTLSEITSDKPALLFVLPDSIDTDIDLSPEKIGEDTMKLPSTANEILVKVKSLIRKNDIYKTFGKRAVQVKKQSIEANKILLIDDDKKLVRLFEYNLSHANFNVKVAYSAFEAIEIVKSFTPDIIVCDIMMPEMDGYQFRKLLLEDTSLKGIPFVFLTAKGDEQDILEGYDLEIEDYILKTAGPRVLVARISAILKSLEKERKKLVSEIHQAADSLRAKVVPDTDPDFEGYVIKHWHEPYKGVPGGDFLDYFSIDDENLAIILGDVMGKKWGAWYFAFAYAGYIRSAIRVVLQSANELSPSVLLQKINESIYQDAKVSEVFATISIVVLNKISKTASYAGAGDFPIIYLNSQTGEINQIISNGLLLGFASDGKYSDTSIELRRNDRLVLLTDGIIESRNSSGEQFGSERLKTIIKGLLQDQELSDTIKKSITEFTSNNFEDDISLITIKSV